MVRSSEGFTVQMAADAWGVSRSTAYQWIFDGIVDCFAKEGRKTPATRAQVWAQKVLKRADVLDHKISPRQLSRAFANRIVRAKRGRFSLDDVDAIRRLAESDAHQRLTAFGPRATTLAAFPILGMVQAHQTARMQERRRSRRERRRRRRRQRRTAGKGPDTPPLFP